MSARKTLKLFEKIYNETYNNTFKYVICKCNNLNNVDDILQDTYLEFYRILKNGKKISNYQAYIITIAKNKIIHKFNSDIKLDTISIYQEVNNEEFIIDLDSRNRYRIRFYNKG